MRAGNARGSPRLCAVASVLCCGGEGVKLALLQLADGRCALRPPNGACADAGKSAACMGGELGRAACCRAAPGRCCRCEAAVLACGACATPSCALLRTRLSLGAAALWKDAWRCGGAGPVPTRPDMLGSW